MGKLKASVFLESGAVSSRRATRFQASLQKERLNKLLDVGNYLFCSKSKHTVSGFVLCRGISLT